MTRGDITKHAKGHWHCSGGEAAGRVRLALLELVRAKQAAVNDVMQFRSLP